MNVHKNAHEMKIKVRCARWLEERYAGASEGRIINEFSANKSRARADLVFVSAEEIVAVEIKSSQDNISRLEGQVSHLKRIYNRVEVVTTGKHLQKARIICAKMHVGLHLVDEDKIVTILNGRRRNIESSALKNRVFPKSIRTRRDFEATEDFYRRFIIQKYGNSKHSGIFPVEAANVEGEYIQNLNPYYVRRLEKKKLRDAYYKDLESLSEALQSIHSSSKSSEDTSSP